MYKRQELVHELLVDVQAAGGIEEDDVVAVVAGILERFLRDGHRIDLPLSLIHI